MLRKVLISMLTFYMQLPALQAQVTLALQVPPVGVMQKSQLWNMALVNTGNSSYTVIVGLTVLSAADNRPLVTALSTPVLLVKGTKHFGSRDLAPLQYTYLSSAFRIDQNPNGFLPVGNYKVCYTVYNYTEGREPLAEDCLPVEVQPLSPPQLNLPADTSTISVLYPQFNWLPPTPIQLFSDLSYDMILVEVLPGQSSYEAVQKNIPVYNISNYKDLVHAYPASNKPLDTARTYAWKVIAKNETEWVAQSEVWTFTIRGPQNPAVVLKPANYIQLKSSQQPVGVNIVESSTIGIKYYSFDADYETFVRFVGVDGKAVREEKVRIVYGDNFLSFKINGGFSKGKVYHIELDDQQSNHYKASFLIK